MPRLQITLYKPLIDAVAILIAAQIGIYIYSASLPFMQLELNTSEFLINCTLTSFILTSGISQLFIGPLSDVYDNKKMILLMLTMLSLSTAGVSISHNIFQLIILRGIQGFAAGSLAVLARAHLKNNYLASELVKYIAIYAIASTIIPIISPILGGVVQDIFNWRITFLIMTIYLSLLLIYFYFKISSSFKSPRIVNNKKLISSLKDNYSCILRSPTFIAFAISNAIIFYIEMEELTFSTYILQNDLHISSINYGGLMSLPAMGFIIGSFIVLRIRNHLNNHKLIMAGIYVLLISGILQLISALFQMQSIIFFILMLTLVNNALAIVISPIVAKAYSLFPEMSGSVIAMMGFIQLSGASLFSFITSNLFSSTQLNFAFLVVLMGLILFALINSISEKIV